ncbi:MAG TPA: nuclear transport factor 2 family protein [Hyphomicrobiales bacterium]|nr:nuclear transport factor 2 family protein [Hyphomicrobiales bacterium]
MSGATGLSVEDRLDIQDLFARYSWAIDLADEELAVTCFAKDCWFDHLWQGRVQGHEAILANLHELWYDRQSWWFARHHVFDTFLMKAENGGARVKSFFQIFQHSVDYNTNFVFGIGTRDDFCIKENGVWVFQSLRVNAWTTVDQVPWKGKITMPPRPGPARPVSSKAAE